MDFIKKKILLRTIVASIVPVTLYSLGFAVLKLANLVNQFDFQMKYFSLVPWSVIGIISALYPVNYVGLWLLFAPVEAWIHKKL